MPGGIRNILLVDDNPADIDLTREALTRSQFASVVGSVCDGEEALEYLRKLGKYDGVKSPDLMILDWNLPRRHGKAVLSAVRADERLRKIPIVIFSSSQSPGDISTSYELGANTYVSKPVSLSAYVSAIELIGNFWLGLAHFPAQEEM